MQHTASGMSCFQLSQQSHISHHIGQHACDIIHRSGGNDQGMVGFLNQAVCMPPDRGGGLVIAGCIQAGVLQGDVLLPEQAKGFVGSLPALLQMWCIDSQHLGSSGLHSQQQAQMGSLPALLQRGTLTASTWAAVGCLHNSRSNWSAVPCSGTSWCSICSCVQLLTRSVRSGRLTQPSWGRTAPAAP